jgi:hypothetical protein
MVPDTVDTSAVPAAPTVIDPLLVAMRQLVRQSPTSTEPDLVRRSASATSATRIEPLADVTLTAPNDPRSSTRPDAVPMTRSQNAGHRISSEPDGRSGRISTMPSATATVLPPSTSTTPARSSAVTLTLPDVVAMRSWTRPGAGTAGIDIASLSPRSRGRSRAPDAGVRGRWHIAWLVARGLAHRVSARDQRGATDTVRPMHGGRADSGVLAVAAWM